ncbi:MAG: hypothetical protein IPO27_15720 [Bacteroidetes bacterium]|nr:hypothetical protein [Bacteroidota bacterium]
MKRILPVILLICQISAAQNLTNIWHFGRFAGLDFNSGAPVSINGGLTYTDEGTATICDGNGQLLFYSDGLTVWNKLHQIMPNGTGLLGGTSSTQSAIIVPAVGNSNQYYVFVTGDIVYQATYSIVDITLNGGLGDITSTKNVIFSPNSDEKVCAVNHANGVDIWIVVKENLTNTFKSYLLTAAGLSSTPVVSSVGINSNGVIGYLKTNLAGNKLAACYWNINQFEVYDYHNATGIVSNNVLLPQKFASSGAYGCEFSPSGQFLYMALITPSQVYQYDISLPNAAAIIASEVLVGTSTSAFSGALQLAPDGKIYLANYSVNYLGAITDPDNPGLSCNFVNQQVTLGTNQSTLGLPNHAAFAVAPGFTAQGFCFGDSTYFTIGSSSGIVAVQWNFDDPNSGAANASYINNPAHLFTAPGNYSVQLITVNSLGNSDTINNIITIIAAPAVNLGNDTTWCPGQAIQLNAGSTGTFLWNNGSTLATYTATDTGAYYVTVTINNCSATDSIYITPGACAIPNVAFSSSDTIWCEKQAIDFTDISTNLPTSWQWTFTGAIPSSSTLQNPTGIYYASYGSFDVKLVACNSAGCDSITIVNFVTEFQSPPPPVVSQSNDTLYSSPMFAYQWFEVGNPTVVLSTLNYLVPPAPGTYYVLGIDSNGCSSASPSVIISSIQDIGGSGISAFYNATEQQIYIRHIRGIASFEVFDVAGRIIFSGNNCNLPCRVSTSDFASGVYCLRATANDKQFVAKVLIVK